MTERLRIGLVLSMVLSGPAQAECLGACANDLMAALLSMVVYGLIGIVLLVMLIRAKWRRAGFWGLGIVAVLAIGVPLVSQTWLGWKLSRVEGREIAGEPPALATRTPLLITPDEYCSENACEAVLRGRGAAGVYVILTRALDGMDLTKAVPLAELPLEIWVQTSVAGDIQRRRLTEAERQSAAGRIDYLIVTSWSYSPGDPGPIEEALRSNAAVPGMGGDEVVRLMMAPLDPTQGLALALLQPDLLDLSLRGRAFAIPLAPGNDQAAGNSAIGVNAAAKAICPAEDPSGNCLSLLER